MKYLLLSTALMVSSLSALANYSQYNYKCIDYSWRVQNVYLKVTDTQGELTYLINGKDSATLSEKLPSTRPQNGFWKELDGDFKSFEAESVRLIADAYLSVPNLVKNYPYGALEMRWSEEGVEEFTQLKCDKY